MRILALFACVLFVSAPVWASSYSSLGCANYLAAKAYIDGVRAEEYKKARAKNRETLKQLEKLNGKWTFASGDPIFQGLKEPLEIKAKEIREHNRWVPEVVLTVTPEHDILSPEFSPVNEGWQTKKHYADYEDWIPVVRTIFSKDETISRTSVKEGKVTYEIVRRQPKEKVLRGKLISHFITTIEPDEAGENLKVDFRIVYPDEVFTIRSASAVFARVP